MLRLSPLLLLLIVFAINPRDVFAQAPDEPDEVIRVETDVTNLPFTAMDKQKRFVTTLREEDIRVFEDDVPQHLFTFQRETDRPLALALLIDVSESEERTLPAEKAAARSFIETVIQSRKDQAAVIPFTGSAFLEQPLTRDVLGIYRALERVEVAMPAYLGSGRAISGIVTGPGTKRAPREGSTAIWDAIALTASEVLTPSVQSQSRRRAIILLTDGQDTSSVLEIDEAIERALAAEAVIYAIGIGDSKYEGIDRDSLRRVAERTGGRAFFPKKEEDLRQVFRDIERELRTQYLIAYSSTNKKRDGAYRQMRIDVVNPELKKERVTLRHRPGYFAKAVSNPGGF
ncbi:MAG TPA: VWA domain-containing protein [Pyrinomonadaceae bacterium]|nr:VWA domain-containing protein [Pyrinomonadaceae bacterium]